MIKLEFNANGEQCHSKKGRMSLKRKGVFELDTWTQGNPASSQRISICIYSLAVCSRAALAKASLKQTDAPPDDIGEDECT